MSQPPRGLEFELLIELALPSHISNFTTRSPSFFALCTTISFYFSTTTDYLVMALQDSEAAECLRAILARSPPKATTFLHTQSLGRQGLTLQVATPRFKPPTKPVFQYPNVNIPESPPRPAPVVIPPSTPDFMFGLLFGSHFSTSGRVYESSPSTSRSGSNPKSLRERIS